MYSHPGVVALLRECDNVRSYAALPGLRDVIDGVIWDYIHPPVYTFHHLVVMESDIVSIACDGRVYGFYHKGKFTPLLIDRREFSIAMPISVTIHSVVRRRDHLCLKLAINDVKYNGTIYLTSLWYYLEYGGLTLYMMELDDYATDWRCIGDSTYRRGDRAYRKNQMRRGRSGLALDPKLNYCRCGDQWYAMNRIGQVFIDRGMGKKSILVGPDRWM